MAPISPPSEDRETNPIDPVEPGKARASFEAQGRPEIPAAGPPDEALAQRDKGPWLELRERVWVCDLAHHRDPVHNKRLEIGRFELLRTIGYGGMGVVLEAYDPKLRRKVALKLWSDKCQAETGAKLQGEAWALARLMHPNVTAAYELGEYDGHPYLVMEYVPGLDAHSWFAQSWREAVDVYIQAGRGLAAAHAVGLLHNDVKPSNILISEDGQVKLTDFGLASSMPRDEGEGKPAGGTPLYMAPEFNRGPASDQFSLCASLYQALYGVPPYVGKNHLQLLLAMDRGDLQVGVALPGIPERVRAAVLRGLSLDPADRHASVAALVSELEQCLAEDRERAESVAVDGGGPQQAEVSERRSARGSGPGQGGLRGLGPVALALLVLTGPLVGMAVTVGAQRVTARSGSFQIAEVVRTQLSVSARTKLAVLAAERGDGEQAQALLAVARKQALDMRPSPRAEVDLELVAAKADEVGMRLFEHQQWERAIDAHKLAALLHDSGKRHEESVRSMHLVYVVSQARARASLQITEAGLHRNK